jgi:hypothetical protein
VYRLRAANGGVYFLKLRKGAYGPSFIIPRYLYDQGLTHVVAPLPTAARTTCRCRAPSPRTGPGR